jgi:hypothetical protein
VGTPVLIAKRCVAARAAATAYGLKKKKKKKKKYSQLF